MLYITAAGLQLTPRSEHKSGFTAYTALIYLLISHSILPSLMNYTPRPQDT